MENLPSSILTTLSVQRGGIKSISTIVQLHQHLPLEVSASRQTVLHSYWSHHSSLSTMTDFLLPLRLCVLFPLPGKHHPVPHVHRHPGKPCSSFTSLCKPIPSHSLANVILLLPGHKNREGGSSTAGMVLLLVGRKAKSVTI